MCNPSQICIVFYCYHIPSVQAGSCTFKHQPCSSRNSIHGRHNKETTRPMQTGHTKHHQQQAIYSSWILQSKHAK